MRLVLQVGGAEIDVDVSAAASATIGQVAEALAGGPVGPGTGLVASRRFLAPATALAGAGLRQGDAVRLSTGPPSGPDPAAVAIAELHVTGGLDAGRRVPLATGPVVLGRAGGRGAGIGLHSSTVSGRHARLVVAAGACTIEDLGSCNGTRVDGRFVSGVETIAAGALLQVGAVQARIVAIPPDRAALARPGRCGHGHGAVQPATPAHAARRPRARHRARGAAGAGARRTLQLGHACRAPRDRPGDGGGVLADHGRLRPVQPGDGGRHVVGGPAPGGPRAPRRGGGPGRCSGRLPR